MVGERTNRLGLKNLHRIARVLKWMAEHWWAYQDRRDRLQETLLMNGLSYSSKR